MANLVTGPLLMSREGFWPSGLQSSKARERVTASVSVVCVCASVGDSKTRLRQGECRAVGSRPVVVMEREHERYERHERRCALGNHQPTCESLLSCLLRFVCLSVLADDVSLSHTSLAWADEQAGSGETTAGEDHGYIHGYLQLQPRTSGSPETCAIMSYHEPTQRSEPSVTVVIAPHRRKASHIYDPRENPWCELFDWPSACSSANDASILIIPPSRVMARGVPESPLPLSQPTPPLPGIPL